MISPARQAAYHILSEIELRGAFSDFALNSQRVASLDERDRHMVTELVYGVERWRGLLDGLLERASNMPWNKVDEGIRIALRMALYQVWRMNRIPAHAAVDEAVELAKIRVGRSASGFVNGVLRNLLRALPWKESGFETGLPAHVRASVPEWLWNRWEARWGATSTSAFCLSLNEVPAKAFWGNPIPGSAQGKASSVVPGTVVARAGSAANPVVHVQDEASQLIPHLFGEIRGWRVWDACAAPGGKSALLIAAAGEAGMVASSDVRPGRAARMAKTLDRISRGRPHVVIADARETPPFTPLFDAVLADVPCSGLGTLRRNPEIKWRFRPDEFHRLARVQDEILRSVSSSVRPGGYLLYSTCSTEPEENENIVDRFLKMNADFQLERPSSPPGIGDWLDGRGMLRTFPSERRWDGFFGALMVRRS